jgi:hypothetical protein
MKAEPRPYSNIISDTYCPEDQSIGCDSCQNDAECLIRLHDDEKCWELPNFGLTCEICDAQEKDRRMIEEKKC